MATAQWSRGRRRVAVTVVLAAVVAVVGIALYSPAVYQWGSTPAEREAPMVGDDIVSDASMIATRAITIDGTPAVVWPWLVQMGVDRAGFYTYDWAERLFADPMHNADVIVEEWQVLDVGDFIHPFPPERGLPSWRVRHLQPERALVVATDDGSWSWSMQLRPLDDGRTRLVTRMRGQRTALSVVLDPADLIVFPRVLVGIEQRVEGTLPGMPGTSTGEPLPTARLPVQWWPALVWLVGTALVGRLLRAGSWRAPRHHPGITLGVAFVAGAGYMIMSDTPPGGFLTQRPVVGVLAATVLAVGGWRLLRGDTGEPVGGARRAGRAVVAVVAVAEVGMLVVLPATAVWQAAVASGWAQTSSGRLVASSLSVAAATIVAGVVTADWRAARRHRLVIPGAFAVAFLATGSGLIPLLGAAVVELLPPIADRDAQGTDEDAAVTVAGGTVLSSPVTGRGHTNAASTDRTVSRS